jgi:hypothetical protein
MSSHYYVKSSGLFQKLKCHYIFKSSDFYFHFQVTRSHEQLSSMSTLFQVCGGHITCSTFLLSLSGITRSHGKCSSSTIYEKPKPAN